MRYRFLKVSIALLIVAFAGVACSSSGSTAPTPTLFLTGPQTLTPFILTVPPAIQNGASTQEATVPPLTNNNTIAGGTSGNTAGGTTGTSGTTAGSTTGNTTNGTCTAPTGWVAYVVQVGDTLSVLATETNATLADLAAANCLVNPDQINVGQTIYLPQDPAAAPASTGVTSGSTGNAANMPTIGTLTITPSTADPATPGAFLVAAGATVTLRVDGVRNANQIIFFATQPNGTPAQIGVSQNPANTAELVWKIPATPGIQLSFLAQATNGSGQNASTPLVKVTITTP